MAEIRSRAQVATDKPVAYMRQLCKHFGHRVDASFGEDGGYRLASRAVRSARRVERRLAGVRPG